MAKGQATAHDLSGHRFGRLTAIKLEVREVQGRRRRYRRAYWLCRCDCGAEKWVIAQSLKKCATQSCGCFNDEKRRASATHGATRGGRHSPEYTVWHSMKQRCTNPNNQRYERYGGRGVSICPQWLDSFERFLADMGPRPPGTSIERIDNDGNYEPGNCRWAASPDQRRNHSRNHWITFRGETLCLDDWVARTGIPHATLSWRVKNWPLEQALTEPLGFSPRKG